MLDGFRRGINALLARLGMLRRLDGTTIGLSPVGEIELRDTARDAWFWCDGWQRAEKQAFSDRKSGHYADFRDLDELIHALDQNTTDPLAAALHRRRA